MRGVSRQLQTTRRERVNVGLSLTVPDSHVESPCGVQMFLPVWTSPLLFILKIIRLNRNLGLKSLVWKRSFQARLTSMMNNFKNMLWAFLSLELNWGFSLFHNFGGRPTFSPVLGIFSFRFCSLELGIRSSPSCCVQGKLETLKVSLDL